MASEARGTPPEICSDDAWLLFRATWKSVFPSEAVALSLIHLLFYLQRKSCIFLGGDDTFFLKIYFYVDMGVLPVCMYVWYVPGAQKRTLDPLKRELTDGCKLLCGC